MHRSRSAWIATRPAGSVCRFPNRAWSAFIVFPFVPALGGKKEGVVVGVFGFLDHPFEADAFEAIGGFRALDEGNAAEVLKHFGSLPAVEFLSPLVLAQAAWCGWSIR